MEASIAVALIGMFGGWIAGWIAAKLNWRAELEKWRRSRSDTVTSDLRTGLQQLTLSLASAVHSMGWLTWLAREGPQRMSQARIDAYDEEMHRLLPQIMGFHAVVASIRPDTYARLKMFIDTIYATDVRIGRASLAFVEGDPGTATAMGSCLGAASDLMEELPRVLRSIISDVAEIPETKLIAA